MSSVDGGKKEKETNKPSHQSRASFSFFHCSTQSDSLLSPSKKKKKNLYLTSSSLLYLIRSSDSSHLIPSSQPNNQKLRFRNPFPFFYHLISIPIHPFID
ncbi:hypothetical protein OCU04_002257 [Sclerotinia nivalis]|uniref:Uncharacterized protein n=1 Tax=Sclerotinia nivalis TaxID=352851 RepID=A0A9X0AZR8_9HELO|nr:hypothetical protein OCU04_002257 [Sclerotinia nivalis]